jgi:hypothetical protein
MGGSWTRNDKHMLVVVIIFGLFIIAVAKAFAPPPFDWDKCDWLVSDWNQVPDHWKEVRVTPSGKNLCVTVTSITVTSN